MCIVHSSNCTHDTIIVVECNICILFFNCFSFLTEYYFQQIRSSILEILNFNKNVQIFISYQQIRDISVAEERHLKKYFQHPRSAPYKVKTNKLCKSHNSSDKLTPSPPHILSSYPTNFSGFFFRLFRFSK